MAREQKIAFRAMHEMGVRSILIYYSNYKCSHSRAISGDRWPDDVRLSDIEPMLICKACGERRELAQRLDHERQVGLDLRAPRRRTGSGQASLGQHPHDGAVVHVQLAGDGADAPLLDMVVA
jgi:hypothetical protein